MKILQIATGVSYSKVYNNLFSSFKKNAVEFEVYIPQHQDKAVSIITKKEFPFDFYSRKIIKPYDKFLYFTKINRMTKDVEDNFDLSSISVIHSHSLFNDGAVAYQIKKKYKIPYIVAIRDTDVNQYFRKAIHLRKKAINILRNAENIIFISKSYEKYVFNKFIPEKHRSELLRKSKVIPNGITDFWLNNKYIKNNKKDNNEFRLIFVGQITKRKNILKIAEASNLLENKYNKKIDLVIIGEKKDEQYFNKISSIRSFEYIPYLKKEKLINYYRNSDIFVMPSITETFGLVYAEAMSQGLPVIYSKGQGFDGQFEDGEVGYRIDPLNALDIADKIKITIDNKENIMQRCYKNADKFNWNSISKQYLRLYKQIKT
ncbi:Glycosyltransferase involved in cell wall bisynthesis [Gracilibacillus orientalis]|uniref:Glycosyltransferase involved in cell wall bisynthesis n=1 Tax=Gracilibacillus orientalis TaxID=334253 RepID=A0A1I4PDZ7_9BACI|nr:glycosyltransferase family 4 protein [Gracilibacillus orientalis]SFM25900.1 Glycosyltransferase involved in cell wall bisynthesis [Gracilibacillus orientalis]